MMKTYAVTVARRHKNYSPQAMWEMCLDEGVKANSFKVLGSLYAVYAFEDTSAIVIRWEQGNPKPTEWYVKD